VLYAGTSRPCASFPLLRELKQKFARLVVSTGATYDDEVRHAADVLHGSDFAFLHCVTIYPTPLDQIHTARMQWLRELAPEVGFSDHTLVARDGLTAAKVAIHQGATIVERHFTILPANETRDGPVSITPQMLAELGAFASLDPDAQVADLDRANPAWRVAIGTADRKLSEQELLNRDYYRGRFASRRPESHNGRRMIFNWEDVPLPS
jgi:N,N'-diacetyllegionaminate synthase